MPATIIDPVCKPEITRSPIAAFAAGAQGVRAGQRCTCRAFQCALPEVMARPTPAILERWEVTGPEVVCLLAA